MYAVERVKGKRIQPGYTICEVEGEPGVFVRIRKKGRLHARVAKADLKGGVIVEEGHLVPAGKVKNERLYSDWLFETLDMGLPRLPADRIARIDAEVEATVKGKATSTDDSFNSVMRRVLGLD